MLPNSRRDTVPRGEMRITVVEQCDSDMRSHAWCRAAAQAHRTKSESSEVCMEIAGVRASLRVRARAHCARKCTGCVSRDRVRDCACMSTRMLCLMLGKSRGFLFQKPPARIPIMPCLCDGVPVCIMPE